MHIKILHKYACIAYRHTRIINAELAKSVYVLLSLKIIVCLTESGENKDVDASYFLIQVWEENQVKECFGELIVGLCGPGNRD